jgi:membrane protease YdiL (CAAX protease family)
MKKLPFLLLFISILCGGIIAIEILDIHKIIVALLLALLLYWLYRNSGLNREDIGASRISRKAIKWSVAAFVLIFSILGLAFLAMPDIFMDERYNQSLLRTIVAICFWLPITTVVLEEFAFRGILLGYLLKVGSRAQALYISSALFGLWHVGSSLYVHADTFLLIKNPSRLLITFAVVLVTGIAGWAFSILRIKTNSLLVPIVAHWSLNAIGMILAWFAWQR